MLNANLFFTEPAVDSAWVAFFSATTYRFPLHAVVAILAIVAVAYLFASNAPPLIAATFRISPRKRRFIELSVRAVSLVMLLQGVCTVLFFATGIALPIENRDALNTPCRIR